MLTMQEERQAGIAGILTGKGFAKQAWFGPGAVFPKPTTSCHMKKLCYIFAGSGISEMPPSKDGRPSIALFLNMKGSSCVTYPICRNYPAVIIKKIIASTIYQVHGHHLIL